MRPPMMPIATVSSIRSCLIGSNERHLARAVSLEVQGGYSNRISSTMRFSCYIRSKLVRWCSQSNHVHVHKLLDEVDGYNTGSIPERSKFLNKVSVLMGYNNIPHLIEQERAHRESDTEVIGVFEDYDFSPISAKFPCIKMGDSSLIELYDEVPFTKYTQNIFSEGLSNLSPNSGGKLEKADEFVDTCLPLGLPSTKTKHLLANEESLSVNQQILQQISVDAEEVLSESPTGSSFPVEVVLDKAIRCLPGTTSAQYRKLEESGFHTVRKLLNHFPRTYADLQNAQGPIADGQYMMFFGTILSSRGFGRISIGIHEIVVTCLLVNADSAPAIEDAVGGSKENKIIFLHLKRFFRGRRYTSQPFLRTIASKHKKGDLVYVTGKVKQMTATDHYEMREYTMDMFEEEEEHCAQLEKRPYPIYPLKAGLKPKFLEEAISRALKLLNADMDPMPSEVLVEFNLPNLFDSYNGIHKPKNRSEADLARRRFLFDEFFYIQLGRLFQMLEALGTRFEKEELLDKYKAHVQNNVCMEEWSPLTKKLLKALPYSLTPSQLSAVGEIIWDLKRPVPMNRLLQGDVGCGKTVVSFLACMEVIGSGFQAAYMVPTELLAIQHYQHLNSMLENFDGNECKPNIALLTGSTSSREARIILKGLQTGEIAMVIGTHSLIADRVGFSALRIAVIDEQQRFGVIQRGRFNSKLYTSPKLRDGDTNTDEASESEVYMAPHILAMSATPIPRTLAFALYGDMSLTQITDLPPGRQPIDTCVMEGNEIGFEKVFQMMRDELIDGGKVYLVYPIIDESEQLPNVQAATAGFDTIPAKFEGYACGLLHGRMKGEEKDEAFTRFRSGETRILLATQVIEIGVDVPDASMMVVMNAERFGIAELHQLRGRVGRGAKKSKCVFLSSSSSSLHKLKELEKSSDGFYLANVDLLLRGPGNLLGRKQSGHLPEFPIARLEVDGNILQEAHLAALKVMGRSNDLEHYPMLKVELSMRQPLCILGD